MAEVTPRCMPIATAAQYVGISISSFRAIVAQDVRPIYMSPRRPVWLREDLDAWINNKAGRTDTHVDPGVAEWDRILDRNTA